MSKASEYAAAVKARPEFKPEGRPVLAFVDANGNLDINEEFTECCMSLKADEALAFGQWLVEWFRPTEGKR